jgi:hypothetical protein
LILKSAALLSAKRRRNALCVLGWVFVWFLCGFLHGQNHGDGVSGNVSEFAIYLAGCFHDLRPLFLNVMSALFSLPDKSHCHMVCLIGDSVLQAIRRSVKPGRNLNIRKLADALVVAYNATVANEADHMTMRFIWKREKRRHNIEKKWSQVVKAASKIDGELADIAADAVAMILPM